MAEATALEALVTEWQEFWDDGVILKHLDGDTADWELEWTDRWREAVDDPETQYVHDGKVALKADAAWGLPVYRFARADDSFGMVWWQDTLGARADSITAFGEEWVYLVNPVALLASVLTVEGERVWIMDKGLMEFSEVSRVRS